MSKYWEIFVNGYTGYASYLWTEITNPSIHSYFYWLVGVSLFFFFLEVVIPWRKKQAVIRKDFWLDAFYMFFNFFLFSLIIYNAASDVVVEAFRSFITSTFGKSLEAVHLLQGKPLWMVLLVGFIVRDFVQWWVHRLLHRVPKLWEYHKVHHSVEQMGFAAHLRYHWMENVVYRTLEYIPLAILGVGLYDFFVIHIFTLAWGHYNHSNISVDRRITGGIIGILLGIVVAYSLLDINAVGNLTGIMKILLVIGSGMLGAFILGPLMKYLFNSPEMHIWHHAYELPDTHKYGINFGLTLAVWDYIFGTAVIPHEGRDIRLGFPGVESFPQDFIHQNTNGVI